MKLDELPTIEYLIQLEKRLNNRIDGVVLPITNVKVVYLRTKGVKALLSVSDNKLRAMRLALEIPYTFIGGTYYYPEDEILKILKDNTINKSN
jgi:hypothetical protein